MDLDFTPEEQAFREEIRAWVADNLPQGHQRQGAQRAAPDARRPAALGQDPRQARAGSARAGRSSSAARAGTRSRSTCSRKRCALAGAPRIVPFGPVMVAPVIMAFGTPEQQKRFLPGIASGEVWWSQGYSEPGSGSDLASLKTKAERQGDKYIVNGQKTWTTLGQYGDWIFCLVRTCNEGKPQTGISFLLIDMKTPGVTVRPIITDGRRARGQRGLLRQRRGAGRQPHRRGEQGLDLRQAPARARAHQHRRRQPRQARARARSSASPRPKASTTTSASATRSRKLEVDVVALEMMVLRVLSAEKSGKKSLDIAGLLKIRGSEIQQRYTELMMLAAGPYALPFDPARRWKPAGRATTSARRLRRAAGRRPTSTCARRRSTAAPTKCSATSSRRRCSAERDRHGFRFQRRPGTCCATPCASGSSKRLRLRAPPRRSSRPAASRARPGSELAELGLPACTSPKTHGGMGMGPVEAMVVMEELGRGLVLEPFAAVALVATQPARRPGARGRRRRSWLPRIAGGQGARRARPPGAQGALPARRTSRRTAARQRRRLERSPARKSIVPAGDQADAFIVPARVSGASTRQDRASSSSSAARRGVEARGYRTQDGARAAEVVLRRRRRHGWSPPARPSRRWSTPSTSASPRSAPKPSA